MFLLLFLLRPPDDDQGRRMRRDDDEDEDDDADEVDEMTVVTFDRSVVLVAVLLLGLVERLERPVLTSVMGAPPRSSPSELDLRAERRKRSRIAILCLYESWRLKLSGFACVVLDASRRGCLSEENLEFEVEGMR